MADLSPLAGLLDRAGHVFSLADGLGRRFQEAHTGRRSQLIPGKLDSRSLLLASSEFATAVLELRDVMEHPPEGLTPVVAALREAASVARQINEAVKKSAGEGFALYLDFWPHLNSVALSGWQAITEVQKTQRAADPFAFLDQPATGTSNATGIDTTPTVPEPPAGLVEAAERGIPVVLADVPPKYDEPIEMVAAHLAKKLQDAQHTLAAAQWAIHKAVRTGRLTTGRVEVHLPQVIHPERRALPEQFFGTLARNQPRRATDTPQTGTKPIPKGKPAPFDCFKVMATESLWAWWRSLSAAQPQGKEPTATSPSEPEKPTPSTPITAAASTTKKSTERGEGRLKLIAALTAHHQYAEGSCLNLEPVNNNDLAKSADVEKSTASDFFKKEFGGHGKYKTQCRRNAAGLALVLKNLNGELYGCELLYGRRPTDEDDREDE